MTLRGSPDSCRDLECQLALPGEDAKASDLAQMWIVVLLCPGWHQMSSIG